MAGTMNFRVDTPARRQEFRDYIDSIKDPQKKQMFEELYQEQLKEWEVEHAESISEGKMRANDFHAKAEGRAPKVRKGGSDLKQKHEFKSSGFTEVPSERSLVPVGKAKSRNDREAFRRAEKNDSAINSAKAQDERHVRLMGSLQNALRKRYAEQPPDRPQISHLKSEIERQYKFHTQVQDEIRRLGGTPNKSLDSKARGILSWIATQEASAQKQSNRAEERKQRANERSAEQNRKTAERQGMAQSRESKREQKREQDKQEREGKAQARESRREQRHERDQQFKAEHQSKEREKDRQARANEAERGRQFRAEQAEGFATARTREREEDFLRRQALSEDRAALEEFRSQEARQRHAERVEFAHLNEHYRRRRERRRMARAVAGATGRGVVSGAQAGMAASRRQKKEQAASRARKRPTRVGSRIGDESDSMAVPILVVGGTVLALMLLVGGTK